MVDALRKYIVYHPHRANVGTESSISRIMAANNRIHDRILQINPVNTIDAFLMIYFFLLCCVSLDLL